MNAFHISSIFCRNILLNRRDYKSTFILEELGLSHGRCRADIAVLGTIFTGFEIKSNTDSLRRLKTQVRFYNAIFDRIYIISGDKHLNKIKKSVPKWWGIIEASITNNSKINFKTIRHAQINTHVDPMSIAHLLWRTEAVEILRNKRIPPKVLREPRAVLYKYLINSFSTSSIKRHLVYFMKQRKTWRYLAPHTQHDDLSHTLAN